MTNISKTFLMIFMILFLNCVKNSHYEVVFEGDKKIVRNFLDYSSEGINSINIKFEKRIGELESSDKNLLFHRPSDIVVDSDNNYYVLDSGNYRVQVFDKNYQFLYSFGSKGSGPGEFRYPLSLNLQGTDRVVVGDRDLKSVITFDLAGKEINRTKIEGSFSGDFKFIDEKRIVISNSGWIFFGLKEEIKHSPIAFVYNVESGKIDSLGFTKQKLVLPGKIVVSKNSFRAIDRDGGIFIGLENENIIEKYDSNHNYVFGIRRLLNFDLKDQERPSADMRSDFPLTVTKGLAVDSKNRLWVATSLVEQHMFDEVTDLEKSGGYILEIFDAENGILLTRVPIDHHVSDIKIIDNDLFVIDMWHSMSIYKYNILD